MKYLLLVISIALTQPLWAKDSAKTSAQRKTAAQKTVGKRSQAPSRSQLLNGIHQECMKRAPRTADHRIKICDCIKRNYDKKLDDTDLAFLLNEYKNVEKNKGKEPPKDSPNQMTEMFSIDVSEKCLEKPGWNLGDPE